MSTRHERPWARQRCRPSTVARRFRMAAASAALLPGRSARSSSRGAAASMAGPGNGDELQMIGAGAVAAHVVGMDPPLSEHIRQDLDFETAIFGANEQVLQVAMPVLRIEHSNCIKE